MQDAHEAIRPSYIEKTPESYKNIARLLEIDRRSLDIDKDCSTYIYAKEIQNSLPKEFIDFVISDDWTKYEETDTVKPKLTLHAKLRLIDRFALNGAKNIDELYSEETTEKLKQILKTVYTDTPTEIRGSDKTKRLIVDFIHNGTEIEAVFSKEGKMVTIVPRRNSKVA